ncbi:MAG: hypothetical protein BWX79_02225 [Alphaproteobacteria bacterium ADurb.Bin100]|nr:MAG: hypothetical protein BWX79_02225 [Alphaproteobacteria bacterium ADurb.Bin100]
MAPADAVGLQDQVGGTVEGLAVQRHRLAFFEAHRDFLGLDHAVLAPEGHAHDGVDDADAAVQVLQVLGLVRGAQHVGVGGVGFLGRHLVAEAVGRHEGGHFGAPAQLIDERLVQPGLVDLERRVCEQAVAVEALDVVAFKGAAIAPDVDVVFLHRGHQHGAGDGAADRGGVEVGDARGRDVEGAALQRGNAFGRQLAAAVDQARLLGAVFHRLARDFVVIGLVGLAQVRRVGVRDGAFLAHPQQRGAGVQAAGERDADLLLGGKVLENRGHGRVSESRAQPKWQM